MDPIEPTVLPEAVPDAERTSRLPRRRTVGLVALGVTVLGIAAAGAVYAATDVPLPKANAQAQVSVVLWSDGTEMARVGRSQPRRACRWTQVSPRRRGRRCSPPRTATSTTRAGISPRGHPAGAVDERPRRRGGAGRLDDHPAVRPERLPDAGADLRASSRRSSIAVKLDRTTARTRSSSATSTPSTSAAAPTASRPRRRPSSASPRPSSPRRRARCWPRCCARRRLRPGGRPGARAGALALRHRRHGRGGLARGRRSRTPTRRCCRAARGDSLAGPQGYLVAQAQDELAALGFSEERVDSGGLVVTHDRRPRGAGRGRPARCASVTGETLPDGVYRALVVRRARHRPHPRAIRRRRLREPAVQLRHAGHRRRPAAPSSPTCSPPPSTSGISLEDQLRRRVAADLRRLRGAATSAARSTARSTSSRRPRTRSTPSTCRWASGPACTRGRRHGRRARHHGRHVQGAARCASISLGVTAVTPARPGHRVRHARRRRRARRAVPRRAGRRPRRLRCCTRPSRPPSACSSPRSPPTPRFALQQRRRPRHRQGARGCRGRPAAGKTGTTNEQHRRLVRRLHAAAGHGRRRSSPRTRTCRCAASPASAR